MPLVLAFIADAILWLVRNRIGVLIVSVISWLGITYGTQTFLIDPLKNQLLSYFTGAAASGELGQAVVQWMGVLQFDKCVTMIFSAVVIKQTMKALHMNILKLV